MKTVKSTNVSDLALFVIYISIEFYGDDNILHNRTSK